MIEFRFKKNKVPGHTNYLRAKQKTVSHHKADSSNMNFSYHDVPYFYVVNYDYSHITRYKNTEYYLPGMSTRKHEVKYL